MIFNSIDFMLFFPVVLLLYFIIPRKLRYLWLLGASYYFYMCWNSKYVLLLLTSTATTWIFSYVIGKMGDRQKWKRLLLAACILINVGILFYFKYFDFFYDTLVKVFGKLGIVLQSRSADVLLPVGISFYIFQALGYIIDIYRGKLAPEKNPLRYALFVSFFPQLVAGPIERTENLMPQLKKLEEKKAFGYENLTEGFVLILWGLFVKMVIADRIAILVDTVFSAYYLNGTVALAAGAMGFALQIYCDFCGYSTIAVGSARMLGIRLMDNFDTPYFARSVAEFWRRWHISLSTWFRDYIYIPLGGNRVSRPRKYFNLLVTMGISGLWHGANWSFVAWGLLHGIYQVVGDMTRGLRDKLYERFHFKTGSFSFALGQTLTTFILVDLGWILFRASSLKDGIRYMVRMFTRWDPWSLFNGKLYELGLDRPECNILMAAVLVLFLVEWIKYRQHKNLVEFLKEQCIPFRLIVIYGLIFAVLIFGVYGIHFDSGQFIYFQF